MRRSLRRLLWRFGCGLVSEDRLANALDQHCRQLFDQRFEHSAVRSQPVPEITAALTRLDEFESILALARSHTRAHRFRRAYQTLVAAESALQHAFRILEASAELAKVTRAWHQVVADLDLMPLQYFAGFRSMETVLRVGHRCLAEGEAAKAKVVTRLAKHQVKEVLSPSGDVDRRAHLDGRLDRVRREMDVPVAQALERILEQPFLELGSRLLDDWETVDPTDLDARLASRLPDVFDELLHRSQNLSAQLARLGEGEN